MKKLNENKELLSPLEVANKLGVSYRTVAWWIQEKEFRLIALGDTSAYMQVSSILG